MEIRPTSCRIDSYRAAFSCASRSQSSTRRCTFANGSVIGSPSGDVEIGPRYLVWDGARGGFVPEVPAEPDADDPIRALPVASPSPGC
ncbi:hypothetical protein GCM10009634_79110 [Saccharothrix xinjiangensis]